jgi:ribose/xylose/arabinose/galactoside ABC-type transport system permease subunit
MNDTVKQTGTTDSRRIKQNSLVMLVNRVGIYVVILALLILGGIVAPGKYFTVANMRATIQAISLLGMVAVGMAFVTYSANYADMSAPMTIAFSGMISVATIWLGFWPSVTAASPPVPSWGLSMD